MSYFHNIQSSVKRQLFFEDTLGSFKQHLPLRAELALTDLVGVNERRDLHFTKQLCCFKCGMIPVAQFLVYLLRNCPRQKLASRAESRSST